MSAQPEERAIWHGIYTEWDEPGAGALCKDGERLIHFSIETDWTKPFDPVVNEVGLALIDQFPRMQQEIDIAMDCAKHYEAEWRSVLAKLAEIERRTDGGGLSAEDGGARVTGPTDHGPDSPFGCPESWGQPMGVWGGDWRLHICKFAEHHVGPCVCKCGDLRDEKDGDR